MFLLEFGSLKEQIDYCVHVIMGEYSELDRRTVYAAVGTAIKKYGFKSVAKSLLSLEGLDESNIFAKISYYCKSMAEVESARESAVSILKNKESIKARSDNMKKMSELDKMLKSPIDGVFKLFCSNKISKDEFESAREDVEFARELIKREYNVE